ncbi:glycosyltransferase [uncultured Jatrophihabitans sp.]|uniref:glycosyltransferase n=1 Tax=uncultured Jatrophihabitans sp. TaxID=1610747 RepID=UPI0035CA41BE
MSRRPHAVWLVDSADPSGAAVLAARRAAVLRAELDSTLVALAAPTSRAPAGSPLAGLPRLSALAGEAHVARADVVVTTSVRTLAAAAPRLPSRARLVHFVHTRPEVELQAELFHRRIATASRVVVPLEADATAFARRAGLEPHQVRAADDFADPAPAGVAAQVDDTPADDTPADSPAAGSPAAHSPAGNSPAGDTAERRRPRRLLAVGRLPAATAVRDLVAALAYASADAGADLADWQLLVAGWGPGLAELTEEVERRRLGERVLLLGARHDVPVLMSRADYLVRLDDGDANGLSVLEALAAGVPVAAARTVPAAARHVRHGQNGWLFDLADPRSLAADLRGLAHPSLAATLRAGAAARTAGSLTQAAHEELRALFGEALAAPPPPAGVRAMR